jgi:hypothetical protein
VERNTALLELRKDPRYPVEMVARIKGLEPLTSTGVPSVAEVLELSRHGLKLKCPRFFVQGTLLQIRIENDFYFGKVRYCVPAGSDHELGVQIQEMGDPTRHLPEAERPRA